MKSRSIICLAFVFMSSLAFAPDIGALEFEGERKIDYDLLKITLRRGQREIIHATCRSRRVDSDHTTTAILYKDLLRIDQVTVDRAEVRIQYFLQGFGDQYLALICRNSGATAERAELEIFEYPTAGERDQ